MRYLLRGRAPWTAVGALLAVTAALAAATALGTDSGPDAPTSPTFDIGQLSFESGSLHTAIAFGPDGRLYVANLGGELRALTLDPATHEVLDIELIAAGLEDVLGIAFDPTADPSPVTIYLTRQVSPDSSNAGASVGHHARVTTLTAPDWQATDVITGLPSNRSTLQQTNGIAFDQQGTLFIAQGAMSFLGLEADSPLSGAILSADIHEPSFDGELVYDPPGDPTNETDLVSGDVDVYAPGLRNPYGVVAHSNGYVYASDNGHRGPDEVNLIELGNYYGFPNGNRCRFDERQCTFVSGDEPSSADHAAPIVTWPGGSACDGMAEYTSDVFGKLMHGDLLCAGFSGHLWWIVLSDDGRTVEQTNLLAENLDQPLDVAVGGDGTIYVGERGRITFYAPNVPSTVTPVPVALAGDVNCDSVTNSIDAALILQLLAALTDFLPCGDNADVNGDSVVNSIDAALILQCSAGLIACASLGE